MTRHMHVSLFLLLLLLLLAQLYTTSGSLAAVTPRCMHGKMKNQSTGPSAGVVRELPRKGQSGMQAYTVATGGRKRIRIVASTRDLENKKRYCSKVGMWIQDFKGEPFLCDKFHVVSNDEMRNIVNYVIPGAIKLHADRLLVDRLKDPLIVPPFKEDSVCNYFTVPVSHHCQGVEEADMVLYVAAKPETPFATSCAEDDSGRPIAAAMNYRELNKFGLRYGVRFAAHELAHALGFDYEVFVKNKIVETQENLRGKKRAVVVAEKTKKAAREHYDCDDLEGLELAFADMDETKPASKWAYRVAKDELMSSSYSIYGPGYYTALTMSVFDALPYYTANWGMEEPMTWGKNASCDFIRKDCITKGVSNFPEMFCSAAAPRCTSDRFAVATCASLDSFKNKDEADKCPYAKPIQTQTSQTLMAAPCTVTLDNNIPGSVTGNNSWCLDGDSLFVKTATRATGQQVGGVCALILCEDDVVKVQYAGNSEWHECKEGESLEPSPESSSFASGKIVCPKYSEVCTIAPNGTSLLPVVLPPGDEFDSVPDNVDEDFFGSSSSADGDSDDNQSGDDNAGSNNQGGNDNAGSDNQGGNDNAGSDNQGGNDNEGSDNQGGNDNEGNGDQGGAGNGGNVNQVGDGCIVPALLAPALLLVMALALLIH